MFERCVDVMQGNYQCSGANSQCVAGGTRGNTSLGANCSSWDMDRLVAGSVKALVDAGFDSVKLDSGFPIGRNLTLWAQLLNQSGREVMVSQGPNAYFTYWTT
jgi:hypothetical protein